MPLTETVSFGVLLKHMRKRAGMTQRDLAAALDYSDSLISSLEKAQGLPNLETVITRFVPALGLQDDPVAAAHLIEQAAAARGERPPASITLQRTQHVVVEEEREEHKERLPLPPTALLGREKEVHQLCNRLLGHSGRLLTLVGPPGIGKTRLGLAVATHLKHYYPDGAVFVPLAEITDLMLMASAIIAKVGASEADSKPPQSRLIEFLRRKTMLLVLDNCEQIRDAGSMVSELLSTCAGLVVLATSRERLHLRAEQRYRVPPLDLAPAVELFTQRAAAIEDSFVLTAVNRPTVEAICQRLDQLPLAIELCAAQTDLLSPAQLLVHLHDRRLDLLVEGAHDLPPRQRTLRTAIEHSYRLLGDEQRTLFRRLGVFAGGFDLGAAEMVAHADVSTLRSLVNKSLVHVETMATGAQRFLLLETLREFALEQLHAHGEEPELGQRHYAAYLQLFRTGERHSRGPESTAWMARLQLEQDNLRAALHWAFATGLHTDMAWLLIASDSFWYLTGQRYEQATWIARLMPHRQTLAVDLRLTVMAEFLGSAGELAEIPALDPYIAEILALMEICPIQHLHATAWAFMSWYAPDAEQTTAALEHAVECARRAADSPPLGAEFAGYTDHEFSLAINLWAYGNFLMNQGQIAEVTPLINESLQLFRTRGTPSWVGDCLGILGFLALLRNDTAAARTYWQEVVTIGTTHNLPMVLCEWQPLLGLVTLYAGDLHAAKVLLEETLALCRRLKSPPYLAQAYTCLAEAALWEEDWEQAAHCLAQSVAYRSTPTQLMIGELFRLFAAVRLAAAQGQYQRAATLAGVTDAAQRRTHNVYAGPALPLVDAAVAQVRAALGTDAFAEAFAAGQQLSLAEALAGIKSQDPHPFTGPPEMFAD